MIQKMLMSSGGGGDTSVLEGVVIEKPTQYGYVLGFNDSTAVVGDNFTGNYLQETWADSIITVRALVNCRVYSKYTDGTTSVNNYSANDVIASFNSNTISQNSGVAFIVLG